MSEHRRRMRRELLLRSLIYVPILALLGFQIWEAYKSAEKRIGIVVLIEGQPVGVKEISSLSPAYDAGLRQGDVILSINSQKVEKSLDYDVAARDFEHERPAEFVVRRGTEIRTFQVTPGMSVDWLPLSVNSVTVLACLAMGLLSMARRSGSLNSVLLNQLLCLLAAEVALPPLLIGLPYVAAAFNVLYYLIVGVQTATCLHLVSLIPERRSWVVRRPWLVPFFYVLGIVVGIWTSVSYLVEDVLRHDVFPWSYEHAEIFMNRVWLIGWVTLVTLLLGSTVLRHPGWQSRRLSAVVLAGMAPVFAYVYTMEALAVLDVDYPFWIEEFWGLTLLPFPASIFLMLRREERARNKVLQNLIQDVEKAGSMEKISELISKDLNLAFYTKSNYVFFRERRDSDFTSVHTSGSLLQVERIPNDYEILRLVDEKGGTLAYDASVAAALPAEEREWLDLLEANLIVPLIESDGHMPGLLILGQKRSEEPYTPADLELLSALARQISIAYENLSLQLQIEQRERVQREVLDRLEGQDVNLVQECPSCGFCFDSTEKTCPRDGHKLELTLPVERVLNERYRLEQVLGRGGVAVVYLASDLSLDRGVAIKVLARTILDDVHAPRRFEREARVAARLIHPHIVTTLDFGKTRNDMPYIVMEYLEGQTLRRILKRETSVDGATLAVWFEQALDGLAAAHALDVVHRDLKPDNVFLVGYPAGPGTVKLLDFGLAKIHAHSSAEETRLTSPGAIMGTLAYMAPEQLAGYDDVDRRSDLYSIGVMAYEAILGKRPFHGRSPAQLLNSVVQGEVRFPDGSPPARRLGEVLARCLDSERKKRYPSVAELKKDLIPALAECPALGVTRSVA